MKQLNSESTELLNKMVGMLENRFAEIENSINPLMSVFIGLVFENDKYLMYSVGHYFHRDGKLTAEPEMRCLYDMEEGIYYPLFYRQDCLDIEENSIKIEGGRIKSVDRVRQPAQTQFANTWFKKIKQQLKL